MHDAMEWLGALLLLIIVIPAMHQAERDKESFKFFCRYQDDLETFYYPNENLMTRKLLSIPDGWADMVATAIGETPYMVKVYVLSLWENGWSVQEIQNRLIERAEANGKQLRFIGSLEPHDPS